MKNTFTSANIVQGERKTKLVLSFFRAAAHIEAAKLIKYSARREKCQISTSESREKACVSFTEGGRDSIKLNLFGHLLFPSAVT